MTTADAVLNAGIDDYISTKNTFAPGCKLHRPDRCPALHIYVQVHVFTKLTIIFEI